MKALKKQNKRRIYIDGKPIRVAYEVYQLLENQKIQLQQKDIVSLCMQFHRLFQT